MAKGIYIVDKESITLLDLKRTLQKEGYDVMTAKDFNLFSTMSSNVALDVLILEATEDGLKLGTAMREICDVPVIYMTTGSAKQVEELAKQGPVLVKPFIEQELVNVVKGTLENQQAQSQ